METIKKLIIELNNNNNQEKLEELGNLISDFHMDNSGTFGRLLEFLEWLKEESEKENPTAQLVLGNFYYVLEKKEEAIKLFKKSAINGNGKSCEILGDKYYNGEYVEENIIEALKWYKMGAENNCHNALTIAQTMFDYIFEKDKNKIFNSILAKEKEITEMKAEIRKYVVKILDKYIIKDLANIVEKFI